MTAYNYCYENKIPVVFGAVSDPVKANLAKSETEPMDGITGSIRPAACRKAA